MSQSVLFLLGFYYNLPPQFAIYCHLGGHGPFAPPEFAYGFTGKMIQASQRYDHDHLKLPVRSIAALTNRQISGL
jgi:hypothetical protein